MDDKANNIVIYIKLLYVGVSSLHKKKKRCYFMLTALLQYSLDHIAFKQ